MPYTEKDLVALTNYINAQRRIGYDIITLRNFLVSRGYDPELVDTAIDRLYKPRKIRGVYEQSLKIAFVFVAILLVIGLGFYGIIKIVEREEASHVRERRMVTGERMVFEMPETITPADKTVIEAERSALRASPAPLIESDPTLTDIKNKLTKISENQGEIMCKSLDDARKKDLCYKELASVSNDQKYCAYITTSDIRDGCYIVFAYANDFSVCEKIDNKYRQLSCRSLGRARKYNTQELLARIK